LIKGSERYIYVFDDASQEALLQTFHDQAASPSLSLNYFDASVLAQKAREQVDGLAEVSASPARRF